LGLIVNYKLKFTVNPVVESRLAGAKANWLLTVVLSVVIENPIF